MSHSGTSAVHKDNSLSIPEILADFFLRKIDMPSHGDDSDHKHKSKRKKSKHKKHKHKKSKYRHRSSNSDTSSKASELKKKVIAANDVSSSEEKDIKRLKKIKSIKCQSASKSVMQSMECDPKDKSDLQTTSISPVFYGPSLELLLSGKESNNFVSKVLFSEEPKNIDSEPNLTVPSNSDENNEIESNLNVENISIENHETDSNLVSKSSKINEDKCNLNVATNSIENHETEHLTVQTQEQISINTVVYSSTNSETKMNKSPDKVNSSVIQCSDANNSVVSKNDTKNEHHCDVQKEPNCETGNIVVESSNDKKDKSDIHSKSEPNPIETKDKSHKKKHSKSRSRSKSRSKHRSPKSKHKRQKSRSISQDSYGSRKKKKYSRSHSNDRKRRSYSRSHSRSRYQKHRRLSRSPHGRRNRRRSRSRSHSYTRYRKRSESRTRRRSRSKRHRSVSKSRYSSTKSKRSDTRSRSKSKSKSRHSSKSKERTKAATSTKIDQAKVLETARKNVLKMMKSGTLPEGLPVENLKKEQLISIQAGGKSVQELTDFCQRLSQKENDPDGSDNEDKPDDRTGFIHHPFKVKEPGIIKLNIKNAVQLPIKTHAQKIAELSSQFPVSSGNQHKKKELEWVPVVPEEKSKTETKPTEKVVSSPVESKNAVIPLENPIPPIPPPPPPPPVPASYSCPSLVHETAVSIPAPIVIPPPVPTASIPLPLQTPDQSAMFYQMPVQPTIQTYVTPTQPVVMSYSIDSVSSSSSIFKPPKKLNIPSIVTKRFQALQKLQEDPTDPEALRTLEEAKESIQEWVQSQQVPGLFTGSTDAKVLSAAELCGPFKHQKFRKKIDFSLHEIVVL